MCAVRQLLSLLPQLLSAQPLLVAPYQHICLCLLSLFLCRSGDKYGWQRPTIAGQLQASQQLS